ncbi:aminotransferase class V-fold PLP-dependent enzyme [Streptomyces sp. WAC 00631]|uniref:aminotransferase class V-fold PLP-dependent enzyme n=1 Tax=unclassified Streptomyces TaxID=2593676 RepID=UPI000F7A5A6A|nr:MULTISPECIES: aminotransferase class V-fold PLP-dependent enzyme [unclassified Streptomyces]MCC5034392.1 aminotransferase class V-fold PLP-dependent enzyme [Streptomyces sp. WAC 00631]MCC9742233.1 aminotransferase class V-fold PLP-dependent enzyme [Streptomyces sp. MNU89]
METTLGGAHFAPKSTYLNTASMGLLPREAAAVLREGVDGTADGRPSPDLGFPSVDRARASFARLAGVDPGRVATSGAVAVHTGLIAGSLPEGAEVLVADGDFSSLVNPFAVRPDLKLRSVPLTALADEVRPGTALVAVSAVQSADGRVADLAAIRAAARAHGARTLVDATQALGWFPVDAGDFDYTVTGAYKWLLCPRGVSFLTVPEDGGGLRPVFSGWTAGEEPWESCYGPVRRLARSARRFDESHALLAYLAAPHALAVIEETGPEAIRAHNLALAERCRSGLAELGYEPVSEPGSAIVAVPGLGHAEEALTAADVHVAIRAGNLRAAFHLYNTAADVDRLLDVLSGLPARP